jgi:hypothetical protein
MVLGFIYIICNYLHYLLILKSEEHRHGSPPKKRAFQPQTGRTKDPIGLPLCWIAL